MTPTPLLYTLFLRVLPLFSIVFFTSNISGQSNLTETLQALELRRFEAMTQRDTSFLDQVLHPRLTYVHSNGFKENKSTHLKNIAKGNLVYSTMDSKEMEVHIHRKTAILNGLVEVTGQFMDKPFHVNLRYTNVYLKRKRSWRMVAWQSAKVD